MSSLDAAQWCGKIIERWGFPTLVAIGVMYVLRVDVLVPLVEEHRSFLRSLAETQEEISQTMREQTRLIYALQRGDRVYSYDLPDYAGQDPDDATPQN